LEIVFLRCVAFGDRRLIGVCTSDAFVGGCSNGTLKGGDFDGLVFPRVWIAYRCRRGSWLGGGALVPGRKEIGCEICLIPIVTGAITVRCARRS
jgi:hypothetical protein